VLPQVRQQIWPYVKPANRIRRIRIMQQTVSRDWPAITA
jgi:hypothetical protein